MGLYLVTMEMEMARLETTVLMAILQRIWTSDTIMVPEIRTRTT